MRIGILAAVAALATASPALAHPKLVSATPAPNASVAATGRLQLTFSEPLVAKFSGVELVMTDMPGMKMSTPMKMTASTAVGPDGKTVVVTLAKPLPRGTYRLDWHVVSSDTHRVKGSYGFMVR
ncbi:copper homeostasis periplasmic binding protein CopC [Sphingomonas donggukensis]|uniref:Copper homeostasis periplasmic binding protein CopC n=1 Tax=Sphingomonas donggukensis TaxID=2949093 RepID=A0ABY4TVU6_9SPHN|nr:copper homeostasis periplasmic binding protein CopC [Sphingomonas donggukensis]URW75841.1 copper homeostasis periplasmic binding protein CopC [Sphingomonas donggukensis]